MCANRDNQQGVELSVEKQYNMQFLTYKLALHPLLKALNMVYVILRISVSPWSYAHTYRKKSVLVGPRSSQYPLLPPEQAASDDECPDLCSVLAV